MKNIKTILITVAAFVMGIIATVVVMRLTVFPDLAKDIAKYGYDSATHAYEIGYTDGENGQHDGMEEYFTSKVFDSVKEWDYKYIH